MSTPTAIECRRCAGTGEYPPTGGDVCSWCDGEGYIVTETDDAAGGFVMSTSTCPNCDSPSPPVRLLIQRPCDHAWHNGNTDDLLTPTWLGQSWNLSVGRFTKPEPG